jgi:hypothetical protein
MGGAKIFFVPERINTGSVMACIECGEKMGLLTGFTAITL